ncbi:MAG: menaquinone biosynthesis protein [Pirellulaceae bacterium]
MTETNRKIRLGAVSYLNTVPLIYNLGDLNDKVDLVLDVPSHLADALRRRELDAGLIPIFEVLQSDEYFVVSDACIACSGPVWSVKLLSRCPIDQAKRVLLDEGSRTSIALTQVLFHHLWKANPVFESLPLAADYHDADGDAVLIIGDRAMQDDVTFEYQYDLGEVWHEWTGLPFVFAVWAMRAGPKLGVLDRGLSVARDSGLLKLDQIVSDQWQRYGLTKDQCRNYLANNLKFTLREPERMAVRRFAELCVSASLLPCDSMVRFYDCKLVG